MADQSISNTIQSIVPGRFERIEEAWNQYQEQESKKTWTQSLKETATSFYYLGKGVAKSGLKLLESGVKTSVPFMLAGQAKDTYEAVTDFKSWQAEKTKQGEGIFQKAEDIVTNPQENLKRLWEGAKDYATDKTVDFLKSSHSEKMEVIGELAGDVAPFLIGAGEARVFSKRGSIIPGGGLAAHEGLQSMYGSTAHTLERHVGKSFVQLSERLATRNYKQISTFRNRQDAEHFINVALKKEENIISQFLTKPLSAIKDENRLILRVPLQENTGDILLRGQDRFISGTGVRLVIDKVGQDSGLPYLLVTGFPIK